MFLACIAYSHWLPYPKNKIIIHISMNSPVEPCSIVLISMCSSKSFGVFSPQLLAMLSTVASSRNLLRKQFSCELHIKRKKNLCAYTASFALFYLCHFTAMRSTFFLGVTGIWRQSDVSSAFLTFRLKSGYMLEALHL